jgi:hypothetical protein
VEYHATGKFSKAAGTKMKTAYALAKAREEKWWRRKIRFIPLAFEILGGWGEEMTKFFEPSGRGRARMPCRRGCSGSRRRPSCS